MQKHDFVGLFLCQLLLMDIFYNFICSLKIVKIMLPIRLECPLQDVGNVGAEGWPL